MSADKSEHPERNHRPPMRLKTTTAVLDRRYNHFNSAVLDRRYNHFNSVVADRRYNHFNSAVVDRRYKTVSGCISP
jgi:hypothetical protein